MTDEQKQRAITASWATSLVLVGSLIGYAGGDEREVVEYRAVAPEDVGDEIQACAEELRARYEAHPVADRLEHLAGVLGGGR